MASAPPPLYMPVIAQGNSSLREGGQFSSMLLQCIAQKTFSPDSDGDRWRAGCCCRMARQCHPLDSTDQPRHSTRSRDPTSLMEYRSAQGAGDMAILSQTFSPILLLPVLSHLWSKYLFYFPLSLSVLGCQIPFLISSSQSQSGKGPSEIH